MNKVMLLGRLGQDPELKYTQSGTAVANFSVATSDKKKNPQTQQWEEETDWHNIVAWGKQAETVGKYLSKGSQLLVEGRMKTRTWDDKNTGRKAYKTEVIMEKMEFISNKSSGQPVAPRPAAPAQMPSANTPPPPDDPLSNMDIPF